MKICYKSEYYITTEPVREDGKYTCRAWKYRTGKEVTSRTILQGLAEVIMRRRRSEKRARPESKS